VRRLACLLSAALLLAACDQSPVLPRGRLIAVASFYPLYALTRQVAGEHVEVLSLVPPGVEAHDWEPSPKDIKRLRRARLFVYNGAGFEPWVAKLQRDGSLKDAVVVQASEGLPLIVPEGSAKPDPHVWLDPVYAQSMVRAIADGLAKADPARAATYKEKANAALWPLQSLDEAFSNGLKDCSRHEIVVTHSAFAYLGKRYGLTVVPIMGMAPESEPSPAQLATIVKFAREKKVKYIFTEPLVSPKLAETLAREADAKTLVLNPIEGITAAEQAAGKDYVTLMEENLKNLRTALGCR
jgi:zinc transport system substrate-binding protein